MNVREIEEAILDITKAQVFTKTQQDERSQYRGAHTKFKQQLEDLVVLYDEKTKRLLAMLRESENGERCMLLDDREFLEEKILRLSDKWRTCIDEIEIRKTKALPRTPHGTEYFIDLNAGNDANTGLSIAQAWLTLQKYTTTTVRTAGDTAYIRANTIQTSNAADVVFDEDGDQDTRIAILGCDDGARDPWSDGSAVKPILTFGDANFYWNAFSDDLWWIDRMVIKESNKQDGNVYQTRSDKWYYSNCEMTDCNNVFGKGVALADGSCKNVFQSCEFKDNPRVNTIHTDGASATYIDCTFDGTAAYGYQAYYGARATFIDCEFGQTTPHVFNDMSLSRGCEVYFRNTLLQNLTIDDDPASTLNPYAFILSEDHQQVKGAQWAWCNHGTVTKDTGVTRTGGADSSAKMEPTAKCGLYAPLALNNWEDTDSAFKIWCEADTAVTVTIYIRSLGIWGGVYPTADELYVEASYFSNAVIAARSTVQSTTVLSDGTTWEAFDVTFTPLQDGFAYLDVYLKKFVAACGIYCDILPVIS